MKNMKNFIILFITAVFIIVAVIGYKVYYNNQISIRASQNNKKYESFLNQQVLGIDVISIINTAIDNNEKKLVEKDESGNYIDNNKDSIKVDIKFLELEKVISMEAINKQGIEQFLQNFAKAYFICTETEYHQSTKNIKYMYFEQL